MHFRYLVIAIVVCLFINPGYSSVTSTATGISVSILKQENHKGDDPLEMKALDGMFKPLANADTWLGNGNYWLKMEVPAQYPAGKVLEMRLIITAEGVSFFQPFNNSVEKIGKTHRKFFLKKSRLKDGFTKMVPASNTRPNIYYIHLVNVKPQFFHPDQIEISSEIHASSRFGSTFFAGFQLAFLMVITMFSVYYFFILREQVYLFFILNIICHAAYFFSNANIIGIHILPGNYELNYYIRVLQPLGIFFYIIFLFKAIDILGGNHIIRKSMINLYLIASLIVQSAVVFLAFFSYYHFTILLFKVNQFQAIGGFIIIGFMFKKFKPMDYFYFTGAVITSMFAFVSTYQSLYYFSSNRIFEIGFMLDVLVFSFGLYYQTRQVLKEKTKVEALNMELSGNVKQKEKVIIEHSIQLAKNKHTHEQISLQLSLMKEKDELDNQNLNKLLSYLNTNDQRHWQDFQYLFNDLHDGFFTSLAKKYPGLSNAELRMCCFLKLSMTSKEIAQFTNQTVKSVEVARSRIRKKLSLDTKESLTGFLHTI